MKEISLSILWILIITVFSFSCHQNIDYERISDPQIKKEEKIDDDSIIKPGIGLDNIRIDDTKESVLQKIAYIPRIKFDAKYDLIDYSNNIYNEAVIQITDIDNNGKILNNRAKFFIKEGKVFQIKVNSIFCKTAEGLGSESLLNDVKIRYPNGTQFILEGSWKSNLTGPKDLIYWVDESQGIAFEFYYHSREKRRKVSAIFIMKPETSFFPLGSDIAPEFTKWVKDEIK